MLYKSICGYIKHEFMKDRVKYVFMDIETGYSHVIYDHKNDIETAKLIELHRHRVLRIEGRVTASGSHQYLNLDRWGVVIDDIVYDPVTMNQGYRKVE